MFPVARGLFIIAISLVAVAASVRGDPTTTLKKADATVFLSADGGVADLAIVGDVNGDGFADLVAGAGKAAYGPVESAGVAVVVFGSGSLPPSIDLASPGSGGAIVLDSAVTNGERLGHAVAPAGDVNGDGYADFLVAAPHAFPGTSCEAGVVYLIYGSPALPAVIDVASLGSRGVAIRGAACCEWAGTSIAAAGDLDGDGYDDVLIGGPGADAGGRTNAGKAYIVFGGPALPPAIDLAGAAGTGVVILGARPDDRLGTAVAGIGDFDGDGHLDVAVTAPSAGAPGRASCGMAYVVLGPIAAPSTIDLRTPGGTPWTEVTGQAAGDFLGNAVAAAADFDADGLPDLLLGAELANDGSRLAAGKAYLLFGRSPAPAAIDLAALGSQGVIFAGLAAGDHLGHAVRAAGDFDRDGTPDILLGADRAKPHGIGEAGQTYLVFGRTSPPPAISLSSFRTGGIYFDGDAPGDRTGQALASGDMNGDGLPDIAIASASGVRTIDPGLVRTGFAGIFLGRAVAPVKDLDCRLTSDGQASLTWTPAGPYDSIQVFRDGALLAVLAGDASSFTDTPPAGLAAYEVVGVRGGASSIPNACDLNVLVRPPYNLYCQTYDGDVYLTWMQPHVVDGTEVFRNGVLLATLPGTATAYLDPAAPTGQWEYRVVNVRGTAESAPVSCRPWVPIPVRDLSCTVSGSDVSLSWELVQIGTAIGIYRDGVEHAFLPATSLAYVDRGVPAGVHSYAIREFIRNDCSAPVACSVHVLHGVADLRGSSDSGDVTLSWTAGDPYDAIEVFREGVSIARLDGTATGFVDPGRPPGSFSYEVAGHLGSSTSPTGAVQVEVPAPVDGLACRADGDRAVLTWLLGSFADAVEVSRDGAPIASLPGNAIFFEDRLPGPGTFRYSVVAVRGDGRSAAATCEAKCPAAPSDVSCALIHGTLVVRWTPGEVYDQVEVTVNGEVQPLLPGGETSAEYSLGATGAARAEVRGIAGTGRSAAATCEGREAGSPFDLSCAARGLAVDLSWSDGAAYDAVRVERDGAVVASLPGDAVSLDDTVPGPGKYRYSVFGSIGGLDTLPAACTVTVNEAVGDLRCVSMGGQVTLTWTAAGSYASTVIERDGAPYAALPPGISTFVDVAPPAGSVLYGVRLSTGASSGVAATCAAEVPPAPGSFACAADGSTVTLTWTDPVPYARIRVRRDGEDIGPPGGLEGTATTFADGGLPPGSHEYEVAGELAGGATSAAARCRAEVIAPPDITVVSSFDGDVCLHWQNPRAYDKVEVLRDGALAAALDGSPASYCERDVAVGTHVYGVRGVAGGTRSDAAGATAIVPPAPSGLDCVQDGSEVRIVWTAVAGADAYLIQRDGQVTSALPGAATVFADTGVPLGPHTWQVRAGVEADFGRAAACAIDLLAPPKDLTFSSDGTSVRIGWTPGAAYDSVEIARNGGTPWSVGGMETSATDGPLAPGVYAYSLTGIAGRNRSAAATGSVLIVSPIYSLACRIEGTTAALSWANGAPYDSIAVLRRGPADASPRAIATLPGDAATFSDEGLAPPGVWSYTLAGTLRGSTSAGASCSASLLPAPGDLACRITETGINSADVELSWTTGGGWPQIAVIRNGMPIATLPGTAASYVDPGVGSGTYAYEVRGTSGRDVSAPARCTLQVLLPVPPISDLSCSIDGSTAAISWKLDRPGDSATLYRRAPGEGEARLLASLPAGSSSYVDGSAASPGDYRYEVAEIRDGRESSRAACEAHKPAAPRALGCPLTSYGRTSGDVRLTWTAPEPYDSVTVLRDGVAVATVPGTVTTYVDQGLPFGTYIYLLTAMKGGDRSDLSSGCSATVAIQPPDPADLECSIADGTATLRWSSTAEYGSIEVRRQRPGEAQASLIATLAGSAESYADHGLTAPGTYAYTVTGIIGGRASGGARCAAQLPRAPIVGPSPCETVRRGSGTDVTVTWTNGDVYDSIIVVRVRSFPIPGETKAVSLRGDQTVFLDANVPDGDYSYAVVGVIGTGSATAAACPIHLEGGVFIRGEINDDHYLDISDPIFLLGYLFLGGPKPQCLEGADVNADGIVDIADAIYFLYWEYFGGTPPPAPFPECGLLPADARLGCEHPTCAP